MYLITARFEKRGSWDTCSAKSSWIHFSDKVLAVQNWTLGKPVFNWELYIVRPSSHFPRLTFVLPGFSPSWFRSTTPKNTRTLWQWTSSVIWPLKNTAQFSLALILVFTKKQNVMIRDRLSLFPVEDPSCLILLTGEQKDTSLLWRTKVSF